MKPDNTKVRIYTAINMYITYTHRHTHTHMHAWITVFSVYAEGSEPAYVLDVYLHNCLLSLAVLMVETSRWTHHLSAEMWLVTNVKVERCNRTEWFPDLLNYTVGVQ